MHLHADATGGPRRVVERRIHGESAPLIRSFRVLYLTLVALLAALQGKAQVTPSRVTVVQVPESGFQPRAVVDGDGVLHLVYFTGESESGDLRYVTSKDGGRSFSRALEVNRGGAKASALGSVRGAQIAISRGGRIHVAWNGVPCRGGHPDSTPMLYTRLEGGQFERERDVIAEHHGLDGGGAVAADSAGNVFVVWHAPGEGPGEEARRVWLAVSRDDGKSFDPESAVSPSGTGVCPCCGLGAVAADGKGLAILYRTAHDGDARDTMLLRSTSKPGELAELLLDPWKVPS